MREGRIMKTPKAHRPRLSRRAIFKGRLRRSLLVGLICTLLIFLCRPFSDSSKPFLFAPSVLPPGGTPDMFVRSTTGPRVVIFVMSNRIDETLCYSVGSAYLSGFPVVVAGYQMHYRGFLSKFNFMERAIANAHLNPEDVAILMDSDTLFTGVDIHPFLDRFITQSAASPEELDALAVRQGHMMAPFLATGEDCCWAPNVFKRIEDCVAGYETVYGKVRKYIAEHPEHRLASRFDLSPQRHPNAGIVVARVWAYKEYLQAVNKLIETQKPPFQTERGWYCDQSIFSLFNLDLLSWEAEQDVFSLPMSELKAARSQYGMRAGFLGLDSRNEFSVIGALRYIHLTEMHDERWPKYPRQDETEGPHSQEMIGTVPVARFVGSLYRRAYAAHGEGIYTKLTVPRWVRGIKTSGKTHITLTPPLFALKLRPIDTENNITRHTFPVLLHATDLEGGFTKIRKLEYASLGAPWLVPMAYSLEVKQQTKEHLASMPLFLSTNSSIILDSYNAKCGFPFGKILRKIKGF